ncbi:MAG: phage tail tube protein [Rhodoglobus sp.]
MTTSQDTSVGIKKESSFGTLATVDSFFEYLEEDFAQNPTYTQGGGLRLGRIVAAADRRRLTHLEPSGTLTLEGFTKGMGKLFEAALGTGVSTVVSGAAFQQLFTPTVGERLPSYTLQVGIPLEGGGAVQPQTYSGMVCSGFELSIGAGGIPMLKFPFVGKDVDVVTGFATPSYAANNQLLSFVDSSIILGGSVTPPTTTALATGGTTLASCRDATFTWDNDLDNDGFFLGGAGKRGRVPALGLRHGSGSLTVEYNTNTLRDAYLAQTDMALVLRFAFPTAIVGPNYPTLELTIPDIRLGGELPKANGGKLVTQTVPFDLFDGRVATSPLYVAIVTTDTAI